MNIQETKKSSGSYPDKLTHLHSPPRRLRQIGYDLVEQLQAPVLAIVGSRKVSSYGRRVTEDFASSASRVGICIVSGLALGVDGIAHQSAINASGRTIAVLPSGLKSVYPATNRNLAKNILLKEGTLVSEYEDTFIPRRESFIERNRIIAALCDALLVTEAAEKSGSLYTARFALEIGKPVLAVPGSIHSPTSAGTNNLIKSGALAVTSEQDIFDVLNLTPKILAKKTVYYGDNEQETLLIKLMADGISSGDELLQKAQMDVGLFQQTLTMLEIKGAIKPLGSNNWQLK